MNQGRKIGGGGVYKKLWSHKRFDLPATAYLKHVFTHLSYTKNSSTTLKGAGRYHELRIKTTFYKIYYELSFIQFCIFSAARRPQHS